MHEELNESHKQEIPFVLILKRKTIRTYPDGTRVALYSNDRLGTTFSIQFSDDTDSKNILQKPISESEEKEVINEGAEEILKKIRAISKQGHKGTIELQSGQNTVVDVYTADALLKVFNKLNDDNKEKFKGLLASDKKNFIKALDFAFGHI